MPPGEDDRPSDPGAFADFGDEVTVPDLKVDVPGLEAPPEETPLPVDDITLDETQQAIARARQMTGEDQSRVVARPAPRDRGSDDAGSLDAFTLEVDVDVEWESEAFHESEDEATVSLSNHQLSKLRAAAASDDSDVFGGRKRPRAVPTDPKALPLPPVLDPNPSE